MNRVAVLITVFNRLDKTIQCLDALFASLANVPEVLTDIYVTDDGSTDSTSSVLPLRYCIHKRNGYLLDVMLLKSMSLILFGVGIFSCIKIEFCGDEKSFCQCDCHHPRL